MSLKGFFVIAVLMLWFPAGYAQQNKFKYKADVTKVDSDGVYKIQLQPRFTAKNALSDLSDIRLIDDQGKFVAYSVVNDSLDRGVPVFIKFSEIEQVTADTATEYTADAAHNRPISNLWLRLKNTEVNRLANLSGSDDLKHWFAIKEGIELQSAAQGNNAEYEQVINFPASIYRYYRIKINNRNREPIKIIQSGIYAAGNEASRVKLDILPTAKLTVKSGKQKTNYLVELDDQYFVDGLKINITAPKYYHRVGIAHDADRMTQDKVYVGLLSSSHENFIDFSGKTDKISIEINNGDDVPLTVRDVIPMHMERSAVAYLEKGHKYYLLTGDSSANEVSYDLTFLHSKPMSQFPVISHTAVYKNPLFGVTVAIVPHRNFTPLLWGAIIVVLIVLSLLTWRMVKELGAK